MKKIDDYCKKYEISLRTARRDMDFVRDRMNINYVYDHYSRQWRVEK